MKVREQMTTDVIVLAPGDSLRHAAQVFSEEHIGGAPVTSNGQPGGKVVGVISMTDLLTFEADHPEGFGDPPYPDRQQDELDRFPAGPNPPMPDPEDLAAYFTEAWSDNGEPLFDRIGEAAQDSTPLSEHTVSEAMTYSVIAVGPDDSLQEAARQLLENDVHRALVMNDSKLVGLLTSTDLLSVLSEPSKEG